MKKRIAAVVSMLLALAMVAGCAAECSVSFEAEVLEIRDSALLVQIVDGPHSPPYDEILVHAEAENLPELRRGDRVQIRFSGVIDETDPAQIRRVSSIERLAPTVVPD